MNSKSKPSRTREHLEPGPIVIVSSAYKFDPRLTSARRIGVFKGAVAQ